MDFQNIRLAVVLPAAFIFLLIIISIPFRTRYIIKQAGNRLLTVKNKPLILPVIILAVSSALIFLAGTREIGLTGNIVVCLVAILGAVIGSEEAALFNKCGVYSNGLIGNGHFLPLKEIYALSCLSYSKEEKQQYGEKVLQIITDRKGTVNFTYSSEKECEEVKNILLKLLPDLKR